jgi:hypothetical protein
VDARNARPGRRPDRHGLRVALRRGLMQYPAPTRRTGRDGTKR